MTYKTKWPLVLVLVLIAAITTLWRVTQQSKDSLVSKLPEVRPVEVRDTVAATEEQRGADARRRRDPIDNTASLPSKLALIDGELGLIRLSPDELSKVLSHFPEVERIENPDVDTSPEERRFSEQLLGLFSREQMREILPSINLGSTSVSDTGSVSSEGRNLNASVASRSVNGELIDIEVTLEERIGATIRTGSRGAKAW
ncbi:hypothetical protein [Haloferula sargassicola]|uniref:Uncharacterized protein n=1 Tax=Haloferula sargassicola TaxID=490096 RepID=A0ABP9URN5_9BACT